MVSPPPKVSAPMPAKRAATRPRVGSCTVGVGTVRADHQEREAMIIAIPNAATVMAPTHLWWKNMRPTAAARSRIGAGPRGGTIIAVIAAPIAMAAWIRERIPDLGRGA